MLFVYWYRVGNEPISCRFDKKKKWKKKLLYSLMRLRRWRTLRRRSTSVENTSARKLWKRISNNNFIICASPPLTYMDTNDRQNPFAVHRNRYSINNRRPELVLFIFFFFSIAYKQHHTLRIITVECFPEYSTRIKTLWLTTLESVQTITRA